MLPRASWAVTVSVIGEPAVVVAGPAMVRPGAVVLTPTELTASLMNGAITETVWMPGVFSVRLWLKVCVPASAALNG